MNREDRIKLLVASEKRLTERVVGYKEIIALVLWSLEAEVLPSERTKGWTKKDRQNALQDCISVLRLPSSVSRKPLEERHQKAVAVLTDEKRSEIRAWFQKEYRSYLKDCEDHGDAMVYLLEDVFAECGMDVWKMTAEDADEVRSIVQEEGELI